MTDTIWFKDYTIEEIKSYAETNMVSHVGIEYTELGPDYLKGTMPADSRTMQPYGILHGGASCVLAESLGSTAGALCVDREKYAVVGVEINANHIRPVSGGFVTGHCKPIHVGRKTHIWQTDIYNEDGKLSATSRLTVMVVEKKK
jgi:1,4-dihydroxy-2-naphthoyl-CoA hydrolase